MSGPHKSPTFMVCLTIAQLLHCLGVVMDLEPRHQHVLQLGPNIPQVSQLG